MNVFVEGSLSYHFSRSLDEVTPLLNFDHADAPLVREILPLPLADDIDIGERINRR